MREMLIFSMGQMFYHVENCLTALGDCSGTTLEQLKKTRLQEIQFEQRHFDLSAQNWRKKTNFDFQML